VQRDEVGGGEPSCKRMVWSVAFWIYYQGIRKPQASSR